MLWCSIWQRIHRKGSVLIVNKEKNALQKFEKRIGYQFQDKNLLRHALMHTSYTNEHGLDKTCSNERLEFLGDAIVDMVVSDYLFGLLEHESEGFLTKIRAAVVCEPSFAHIATKFDYGSVLFLGKGEAACGGRSRASVLADAFEAVIAAIYLDSNMETVSSWIIGKLERTIKLAIQGKIMKDYKTLLQEQVQKDDHGRVSYRTLREQGPDHAKTFTVAVLINGTVAGVGKGTSKKDAEQAAASTALSSITGE